MCSEEKITFYEHANILAEKHLNGSKLHLNKSGDSILASNILRASRILFENSLQVSNVLKIVENNEKVLTDINENLGIHEIANSNEVEEPNAILKDLRIKNHNGIIIAYLNIN